MRNVAGQIVAIWSKVQVKASRSISIFRKRLAQPFDFETGAKQR
jgi:hypothetical protein